MRTRILFLAAFLFLISGPVLGQVTSIKGKIVDGEGESLPSATAMLMNAKDSVLVHFVLSDLEGNFNFKKVEKGDYYVQLSYLQYDMLRVTVPVDGSKEEVDLGKVIMTPEGTTLESVEITAELIPVLIKGDTIEYNADAFKVRPNENVERLLKQLPGIEVDKDGNIKAQGETVQRVLVDGKEFFGNDPKVATQNLPADAVDKVQVFDKLSDVAEFSGIDDGERSKTINLALKDDRKTGYFGNIGAGYGTEERFEGKLNLNRFTPKSQTSVLGMANNTNQQPFSVSDYINFMGGVSNLISQGGFGRMGGGQSQIGLSPSDLGISSFGGSQGLSNNGIALTGAAGLNYNVDLGKRWDIQSSYFYNYISNTIDRDIYRETVTEGVPFVTDDATDQGDVNNNHRITLYTKFKADSATEVIFRGSARLNNADGDQVNSLSNYQNDLLQNQSSSRYLSTGGLLNTNNALTYRKRLKKKGRTISLQGNFQYQDDDNENVLASSNSFYNDTLVFTRDINQDQLQAVNSLNLTGRVTYTEPIGKRQYLNFNYRHGENFYSLDKDFYDLLPNREFNDTLSNAFKSIYRLDRGGVKLQWNTKKAKISAGVDLQRSLLEGDLISADTTFRKEFVNLLPSFRYNYEFRKGRRIRINYEPSVNEPSITQLQPVVDNSNPINVYAGNPDLLAEYAHNLNGNFVFFDQFSFTSLFLRAGASYTRNKISNATTIDPLFRQFTTPVNVDYDYRVSTNAYFSTPIRMIKTKINLNGGFVYNRGISFINTVENPTTRTTTTSDVSLENRKKEVIDARAGVRLSYNTTRYDISTEFNQEFLNLTYYADISVDFLKTFTLGTEFEYTEYKGGLLPQPSFALWTAYLAKSFLKNDRGQLKVSAFDLLNQNQGINRSTDLNYFQEERIQVLNRYYMLTFTYSIISAGRKR